MKKFALLGAVAALATAGGVFAAWTFSNSSVTKPANQPISITIDASDLDESAGSYGSFTVTGTLEFTIESDGTKDNNAIVFEAVEDSKITITYNSTTAENETVRTTASIAAKGASTVAAGSDVTVEHKAWTKDFTFTDASNTATITAAEILSSIVFANTINTKTELNAFAAAVANAMPTITFSDCTVSV